MSCKCKKYKHLELKRSEISRRIRQSKKLKNKLQIIAKHSSSEHKLLKCPECGQYWQSSGVWNRGNYPYLFKVPEIDPDNWLHEPYIQPDELLIYVAIMSKYMSQDFVKSSRVCRVDGCNEHALDISAFCLSRHIRSLQKVSLLPKDPHGRWFLPYHRAGDDIDN